MILLETKEQLTLTELLRIAYEYGNQNAVRPEDEPEVIDKEFNEWMGGNNELLNKLTMNNIRVCDCIKKDSWYAKIHNGEDCEDCNRIIIYKP